MLRYQVKPRETFICTNPKCKEGQPHWRRFGKRGGKCYLCGKPGEIIQGEPQGTRHI